MRGEEGGKEKNHTTRGEIGDPGGDLRGRISDLVALFDKTESGANDSAEVP